MPQAETDIRKFCEQRHGALKQERSSYEPHWRELSDYILPRRGQFLVTSNSGNRGQKRNQKILDSTGTLAARTSSSGMMSGLTSPARAWFRLGLEDDDLASYAPVKEYLDETRRRMLRVFAKSNLYNVLAVFYEEMIVFGTGCFIVTEDYEDVVRGYALSVGEYYLSASERLAIDTLYREVQMTIGQMVEKFGLEACPDTVQKLWKEGQLHQEYTVYHAIEPNPARWPDAEIGKPDWLGGFSDKMPYRSVYWTAGDKDKLLGVAGFEEQSFMGARWHLVGNETYGRSPGMDALPDILSLTLMEKDRQKAVSLIARPPMTAPASMRNEPATILPGGVTYVTAQDAASGGFKPAYQVDPKLTELLASMQEKQEQVRRAFYADLFLMLSQMEGVQPRNQLEIAERKEEKLLQLGPVLERLHDEALDPLIIRVYSIMARRGLLPAKPRELANSEIQIEYISQLAQAQKSVGTTGIERLFGFMGNLAAVKPEILDKGDADQAFDDYADMLGVNPKVVVSKEQVAKIRADRANQAAAQARMQASLAAVQGAKLLSETEVGAGRNALQQMVGTA